MKNILAIDISGCFIRYVYLMKHGRHFAVQSAGRAELDMNAALSGVLSRAIQKIIDEKKIVPSQIFVSLSGQEPLLQQMTLPNLADDELIEAIKSEVGRLPKFLDIDFDFIFNSYPITDDQQRVILAAVPQSFLTTLSQEIKNFKNVVFKGVEIAPMNLKPVLSFFDRRGKSEREQKVFSREDSIVVLLHDEGMTVEIYREHDVRLFYHSSSGLAQWMKAATPEAKQKILADWASECGRVFKAYLMQTKGQTIHQAVLIWDQELIPDLDQQLSKHIDMVFQRPVTPDKGRIRDLEKINPIYLIALTPVLIFLNKIKTRFAINHFFRAERLKRLLFILFLAAGVYVGALVVAFGWFITYMSSHSSGIKQSFDTKRAQIEALETQSAAMFAKKNAYEASKKRMIQQAMFVNALNRVSWAQVFAVFSGELPEKMSLTVFKFSNDGGAMMRGEAFEMEDVAALMRRIETSQILTNPRFEFLRQKRMTNQNVLFYEFEISAQLKDPKEMLEKADPVWTRWYAGVKPYFDKLEEIQALNVMLTVMNQEKMTKEDLKSAVGALEQAVQDLDTIVPPEELRQFHQMTVDFYRASSGCVYDIGQKTNGAPLCLDDMEAARKAMIEEKRKIFLQYKAPPSMMKSLLEPD